jgi:ABC-type nitrate/sulfonate/bicarbonate transport system substrate-binding protein
VVDGDSGDSTSEVAARRKRRQILKWGLAGSAVALGLGYAGYRVYDAGLASVRLGIAPGSQTLWRYVAQRKGDLLGSLGYDTTFVTYQDESTLRVAFAEGKIDVMASLTPTVALLAGAGIPARLFLPIGWLREGYPFVVASDSSIDSLADLPGRRVATYPLGHPGMAYWLALGLATANLNLAALNPRQTLSPEVLLQRKEVEAACVGGSQWAVLSKIAGYRKLTDLQTVWQGLNGNPRLLLFGGYIARADFIQTHGKFVADFIQAHARALDEYKKNRADFLRVAASYNAGFAMSSADNQVQATYLGYDDVGPDRLTIGDDDIADYARLFALMAKAGFLRRAIADPGSLFYRSA